MAVLCFKFKGLADMFKIVVLILGLLGFIWTLLRIDLMMDGLTKADINMAFPFGLGYFVICVLTFAWGLTVCNRTETIRMRRIDIIWHTFWGLVHIVPSIPYFASENPSHLARIFVGLCGIVNGLLYLMIAFWLWRESGQLVQVVNPEIVTEDYILPPPKPPPKLQIQEIISAPQTLTNPAQTISDPGDQQQHHRRNSQRHDSQSHERRHSENQGHNHEHGQHSHAHNHEESHDKRHSIVRRVNGVNSGDVKIQISLEDI